MSTKRFVVILDANVLFPFTLRDTLLRAAEQNFYDLRWSPQILEEVTKSLVTSKAMPLDKAVRLRSKMEQVFRWGLVRNYEHLEPFMKNQEKDRHVAAAAQKANAQTIVTFNLKDFKDLPKGIKAQSPDQFLSFLFKRKPLSFVEMLRAQAQDLRNPPMSLNDLLHRLAQSTPKLVEAIRSFIATS